MEDHKEAAHQADTYAKSAVQSNADESLRRKRKASGQRACQPCRQRKVRCNYETPCQTCIDRNHSELCHYQSPSKRVSVGSIETLPPNVDSDKAPRAEWDRLYSKIEQFLRELKRDLRSLSAGDPPPSAGNNVPQVDWTSQELRSNALDTSAQGINTNNDLTGETMHLGGNSVPAMVVALGKGSPEETVQELVRNSVLPLFGLDNESATYPFVDLWGLPHGSSARIDGLCKLVPPDADCLQYFRQYRDTANVLYPGVVDVRQFELDLTQFLVNRATRAANINSEPLTEHDVYGKSLHWVGLLFATLASGCQCSGIARKERQLTCQVYGREAFAYECLRIINYLSRSTLDDIQNLLVLGNVISNNMNAGVAWSLLGLTIRLAQSLGLHRPCSPSADNILREEVWWRVVWQDSLLSITYDRASSTPTIGHYQPIRASASASASDGLSYVECMKQLCKIGLDIVRDRSEPQDYEHELLVIIDRRDELAGMMKRALHHLRDATACKSMEDQLEHWNLHLHRAYLTSELYRPTLKHKTPDSGLKAHLKVTCIESLADTVDAFLGLQNITRFANQSWAAVHRSLSSALLLGILKEPARNQRVRTLIDNLIAVMSDVISTLDPSELSAPITRAVSALRLLNSRDVEAPPGQRWPNESPMTNWYEGNPQVSSTFNEHWQLIASSPDSSNEGSPYVLMDKILWGREQVS